MSNIAPLIDDYGLLKAQIAELEMKASTIHAQLAALGQGAYEGEYFRVTVSKTERATIDMKAMRRKLSRQFIKAHSTLTSVTSVRLSGRNAVGVILEAAE